MSSLIENFLSLKNNYRCYDTRHALKRMQAFRCAVRMLTSQGYPIALELLGSIDFGMTDISSDADCVLLHYCEKHQEEGECPADCVNLVYEKEKLISVLKMYMYADEAFEIELLDWLNLKYIENILDNGQYRDNEIVYRLLYYRTVGRPVNRPLIIKYCDILERDEELMKGFRVWSSGALAAYLSTSAHRHSFGKYNERIVHRGLALPEALRNELITYLD